VHVQIPNLWALSLSNPFFLIKFNFWALSPLIWPKPNMTKGHDQVLTTMLYSIPLELWAPRDHKISAPQFLWTCELVESQTHAGIDGSQCRIDKWWRSLRRPGLWQVFLFQNTNSLESRTLQFISTVNVSSTSDVQDWFQPLGLVEHSMHPKIPLLIFFFFGYHLSQFPITE
jgi:hypothetical protein